jgi:hypothetical protein
VTEDVLVLPAHNEPFTGLHDRLASLAQGHEQSLLRLRQHITEPMRVIDVFPVLFRRRIDSKSLLLATGESVSHLHCLIGRGLATCEADAGGVNWYRAT